MRQPEMGTPVAPREDGAPRPPNGDDRLMAALAHFSVFLGLWILIPAAIFLARRKRSAFVAFHAMQAVVMSVLLMGLGFVAAILVFGGYALGSFSGVAGEPAVLLIGLFVVGYGALAIPWLWSLIAAVKAWNGKRYAIPIAGRIAARLVARDAELTAGGDGTTTSDTTSNWSGLR